MNRRHFLAVSAAALTARAAELQTFTAGIVPAGRGRTTDPAQTYWSNCDEASGLGFQHIEINNTRAQIAEKYLARIPEFKEEMNKRHLRMAGLALFSHIARTSADRELIDVHMLLGTFSAAVGGKYITHMLAPGDALNEADNDEAYSQIDVKVWAANANEIGKRLLNEYGVALAYHPEQAEVRTGLYERILAESDERYLRFLADTGHLAAGGADCSAVCRKYRSRLECVHLKQFSPAVRPLQAGNVPFGEGVVDLLGVVAVLRDDGFKGYVMSESGGTNPVMHRYMTENLGLKV